MQTAMVARGIRKQIVLASQLGVNESAVSRWQQGAGLSLDHAIKLCEALDISLDWLILGRGSMDQHRRDTLASKNPDEIVDLENLPPSIVAAFYALAECIRAEIVKAE
ncbi:helix-turn-helix domain-containing protein [Acidisoma sp. 7E03]